MNLIKLVENLFLYCKRALAFETSDTFLTEEDAKHINERHFSNADSGSRTSTFSQDVDLTELLKNLSAQTWEKETEDMKILEEGFKYGHNHYMIYVFNIHKVIGKDPRGFPATHIAVYYSERKKGDKWRVVSAYPFSFEYDAWYQSQRARRFRQFR